MDPPNDITANAGAAATSAAAAANNNNNPFPDTPQVQQGKHIRKIQVIRIYI